MVVVGIQANSLTALSVCHVLILVHTPGPNTLSLKLRQHSEAVGIKGWFTSRIPGFPHPWDRAIVCGGLCANREGPDEQLLVVHGVGPALLHSFALQPHGILGDPMAHPPPPPPL